MQPPDEPPGNERRERLTAALFVTLVAGGAAAGAIAAAKPADRTATAITLAVLYAIAVLGFTWGRIVVAVLRAARATLIWWYRLRYGRR